MKPTRTVKTADTLVNVITSLQQLEGSGVTELAEHLGLAKSTAHDHLATLREHGYVTKEGDTYHLSLRFLDHGTYARDRLSIKEVVLPVIGRLAEDTEETVWFSVAEQNELVYLFRAVGQRGVDFVCRPGRRMPMHTTAPGKAILATYSNERVREIAAAQKLTQWTSNTVTDIEVLVDQLSTIRDDEVAITVGEEHPNIASLAASVSESNETVGAISISGPKDRFTGEDSEAMKSELLATVDELELRLSDDICP
jgi:IclR family acetate operon transcriptional repressor